MAGFRFKSKPQIVMQQRETDCGAACFATVLKFYGVKKVHLSAVHELLRSGRDGTSFDQLVNSFKEIGINAEPVETNIKSLKSRYQKSQNVNKPTILHWQGNHFVVLFRIDNKSVFIADPAIGIINMSHKDFVEKWTGFALFIETEDSFNLEDLSFVSPSAWKKFSPLLYNSRKTLAVVLTLAIVLQLLALLQPLGMKYLFDNLEVSNRYFIDLIIGGLLFVIAFEAIIQFLRSLLLTKTELLQNFSMKEMFFGHLFALPTSFFNRQRVGDLITLSSDTTVVGQLLAGKTLVVILDLFTFITYLALLYYLQVKLLLISLLFIPLYGLTVIISARFLQKLHRINFVKSAELQSYTLEHLNAMSTIKALALENQVTAKIQKLIYNLQENQLKTSRLKLISEAINKLFLVGGQTVIFWYGVRLVFNNELTIGSLIAFLAALGGLMRPAGSLVDLWNEIQQVRLAFERLGTFFATTAEESLAKPDKVQDERFYESGIGESSVIENNSRDIEFKTDAPNLLIKDVSYKYHGSGKFDSYALSDINLELDSGKVYGITGASGSGKSTLAQLLVRFDDPTEGQIYYKGARLDHITPHRLRSEIGYVSQDVYLFNTTIYENIAYGNVNVGEDDVRKYAEIVEADDFIKDMPKEYMTILSERGMGLSGGQRQRLALARMLCRKPKLLILDEATSALDLESESRICKNLTSYFNERTTIIISHRKEIFKYVDEVITLEKGHLVDTSG